MKNWLLCLTSLILLSLGGVAWAEPVVISFWHAFSGPREARLTELVRRFELDNPEFRVELRGFRDQRGRGNDYAELYRNVLRSLDEKAPPVVALMYENWVTQLADLGLLVVLDQQMGTAWSDMPPIFRQASTHRDGKRYSVPFNKSLWTLYVNRKLTVGQEPPQNWSELLQRCEAMRESWPDGVVAVATPFELFSLYFVSQGGRYFSSSPPRPGFAGALGISSGKYVQSLASLCLFGQEAHRQFAQGKVPYLLDTSAKLQQLEAELGGDLQILPLPRGAGDRIQLTGTQLSVFSGHSSAHKRGGLRLLRYLIAPEQQLEWSTLTGYLPVRASVYESPAYIEYLKQNPGRAVISNGLSRARVQPQVIGWEATRVILNDALERVLYQKAPLEGELRQAQRLCNQLIRGLQGGTE